MFLRYRHGKTWIAREQGQAEKLQAAAVKYRRHWPTFRSDVFSPDGLGALNVFARIALFRSLSARLFAELNVRAPNFAHPEHLRFITIIDRQNVHLGEGPEGDDVGAGLTEIANHYGRMIRGLNCVAMIEPAFYVSSQWATGHNKFLNYHAHLLSWGTSPKKLKEWAKDVREDCSSTVPYANPVILEPINQGDIRQMVWYLTKTPRRQYQLYRKTDAEPSKNGIVRVRLKQYDGPLRPKGMLTVYDAMRTTQLLTLLRSAGKGVRVRDKVVEDVERHAAENAPPLLSRS